VTVKVRLVEVDGRRVRFEVEAHDGVELISKGEHERVIIERARFDTKMKNKREARQS
jgi:fluoroacetyl-CoA thioesterase